MLVDAGGTRTHGVSTCDTNCRPQKSWFRGNSTTGFLVSHRKHSVHAIDAHVRLSCVVDPRGFLQMSKPRPFLSAQHRTEGPPSWTAAWVFRAGWLVCQSGIGPASIAYQAIARPLSYRHVNCVWRSRQHFSGPQPNLDPRPIVVAGVDPSVPKNETYSTARARAARRDSNPRRQIGASSVCCPPDLRRVEPTLCC